VRQTISELRHHSLPLNLFATKLHIRNKVCRVSWSRYLIGQIESQRPKLYRRAINTFTWQRPWHLAMYKPITSSPKWLGPRIKIWDISPQRDWTIRPTDWPSVCPNVNWTCMKDYSPALNLNILATALFHLWKLCYFGNNYCNVKLVFRRKDDSQ
jgi:hypothetical protein